MVDEDNFTPGDLAEFAMMAEYDDDGWGEHEEAKFQFRLELRREWEEHYEAFTAVLRQEFDHYVADPASVPHIAEQIAAASAVPVQPKDLATIKQRVAALFNTKN